MGNSEYILNCEGISKAFGGTQALKDVQLHVKPGEVHALLGENGAGKSTLMKCVIGLIKQDAGTMEFEGKPYQAKGPVQQYFGSFREMEFPLRQVFYGKMTWITRQQKHWHPK